MAAPVKGQATLDAANARRKSAAEKRNETALALATPESGYEKPKSLKALEGIVERNAAKGLSFWKTAGEALLTIKEHRLWKGATPVDDGEPYANFSDYAERRFGFKKTYAYDLAAAAKHTPEALTERAGREERANARAETPLRPDAAVKKIMNKFERFEEQANAQRDRAIDHEDFTRDYDATARQMRELMEELVDKWEVVIGEAVDVSPLREADSDDVPTM